LLNSPSPQPSPASGAAPSPPPQAPATAPPPPASWPVPAPPTSTGGKGIRYTESALDRFAGTSDQRATAFQQIHAKAEQVQVSPDAFGVMFGRLVYSAYAQHAQAVTDGMMSAAQAMTGIADAVRQSAEDIHNVDTAAARAATQILGSA
jgi:uncharacterized protein YukE